MDEQTPVEEQAKFWDHHRFLLLIGLTIVVALILVSVSLAIYNLSGAAQLDLSRPGFKGVAAQAESGNSGFKSYDASGPVNSTTIKEFQSLYSSQTSDVTAVDAFGGDPLNIDTLESSGTNE
jgi:hypothetical protein